MRQLTSQEKLTHFRSFCWHSFAFRLPVDNPKYKTKLCDKYTKTGVCPYGDRCLFIHPKSMGSGDVASNPYIHPARVSLFHAVIFGFC